MYKDKSQHFNYTREALPTLFHSQTEGFLKYAQKDKVKFLEFWWEHVGERLPDELCSPFTGAQIEIREVPERKSRIVLVRLPPVNAFGDFHFMAFVELPKKRYPFMMRIPNTKVVALAHEPLEKSDSGTLLYEITPRGRVVPVAKGPKPGKEAFYNAVLKYVWKNK